jgi:uncharacterized membrane protein YidH (DUF202 family)
MDKPNLIESITPHSGHYSLKRDLHLNAWLAVAVGTYLAELYLSNQNPEWSPLTRGLIALAPLMPGFLYIRSWLRYIRDMDELQQRIQLEAFLFTALGTIIVGAVINTLNANGVSLGSLHHGLGLGGVFIVMYALWLVGGAAANCRYK